MKKTKPREFLVVDTGSLFLTCRYDGGPVAKKRLFDALACRHGAQNVIHVYECRREVLPRKSSRKGGRRSEKD